MCPVFCTQAFSHTGLEAPRAPSFSPGKGLGHHRSGLPDIPDNDRGARRAYVRVNVFQLLVFAVLEIKWGSLYLLIYFKIEIKNLLRVNVNRFLIKNCIFPLHSMLSYRNHSALSHTMDLPSGDLPL